MRPEIKPAGGGAGEKFRVLATGANQIVSTNMATKPASGCDLLILPKSCVMAVVMV
jgi:hypothetical protein